jgi:hypothetical protein
MNNPADIAVPTSPAASPRKRTYARARLWLGITGVGTIVLCSVGALTADLPSRAIPDTPQPLGTELVALAAFLGVYMLVSLPFDIMGGVIIPTRHGRQILTTPAWIRAWIRGSLSQAAVLLLVALVLLQVGRRGGAVAVLAMMGVLSLLLLRYQLPLARVVAALPERPSPEGSSERLVIVAADDDGFVGAPTGWPGAETLVVPSHWLDRLPTAQWQAQLARRRAALATGSRRRGVLLALGWNLAGFAVALLASGGEIVSVVDVVELSLWFTLWSFLGLLLLPTPSRRGVLEVDASARANGVPADDLRALFSSLDRWQDDEPTRPRGIETVFHPVPARSVRIAALAAPTTMRGAWHAARMALPLSWAGLGLLGRAVHCNSGRPALWVMLPGD